MPELPEVQTVVDTLRPAAVGRVVAAVRLHRADVLDPAGFDLAAAVAGRTVAAVDRRGKKIVVSLDDGCRFVVHLGMTGRLTAEPAEAATQPHTHLVLYLSDGRTIRFRDPRRFGGVWWLGRDGRDDVNLGPEPLTLSPGELAERLGRTARAIKTALLDQKVVAGLGNIYVDESLHRAGHPPDDAGEGGAGRGRRPAEPGDQTDAADGHPPPRVDAAGLRRRRRQRRRVPVAARRLRPGRRAVPGVRYRDPADRARRPVDAFLSALPADRRRR